MGSRSRHSAIVLLLLLAASCALYESREQTFLRQAKGRATQEEVQQRLGSPTLVRSTDSESVWVYHKWNWQPGNRATAPGGWCDEFLLVFDADQILRHWTYKNQFHGGEAFPRYCVRNGLAPSS